MKNRFCFGLTILLFLLLPARGRPKPHYTFVLPDKYVGWIQAVFNDSDALPLPKRKDGGYHIDVPESGIPRTSDFHVLDARAKDEFYYRVQLPGGGTELQRVPKRMYCLALPMAASLWRTLIEKGGGHPGTSLSDRLNYGQKFLTQTGTRW